LYVFSDCNKYHARIHPQKVAYPSNNAMCNSFDREKTLEK
jgi:hypothetical protein